MIMCVCVCVYMTALMCFCVCVYISAKDGSTYSGDWRDGKRHGSGILEVRVVVS